MGYLCKYTQDLINQLSSMNCWTTLNTTLDNDTICLGVHFPDNCLAIFFPFAKDFSNHTITVRHNSNTAICNFTLDYVIHYAHTHVHACVYTHTRVYIWNKPNFGFKDFFIIWKEERERDQRERERDLHSPFFIPQPPTKPGQDQVKPEAKNSVQVSHMGDRNSNSLGVIDSSQTH